MIELAEVAYRLLVKVNVTPAQRSSAYRRIVPDATSLAIREYVTDDEQSLLAIVRYNRLVDTFSATTELVGRTIYVREP